MEWTSQQARAIDSVHAWLKDKKGKQVFRLFGYAGTGKTTIAKAIREGIDGNVIFGAFTGKACLVLRRKGCTGASTIHSLIYKLEDQHNGQPHFILNRDSDVKYAKLVIIDECSMVDEDLGRDLESFGTRILVLGDPFQLPPVKGAGYFTEGVEPDAMLTDIRRQALDNPIIRMSMDIREGRGLELGQYGDSRVITRNELETQDVLDADQVLVGLNRTRRGYNARIRQLLGFQFGTPQRDDRLVCLRNKRDKQLLNGGIWTVKRASAPDRHGIIKMAVKSEDDELLTYPVDVNVYQNFFHGTEEALEWHQRRETEEFDFGYALTCHKSQGSQWDDVMVFDESRAFRRDADRWLYTGITRAAERVTVVN